MFPEIARRIAGINETPIDAMLSNFARYTIEDREIAKVPAIIAETNSKVLGKLYRQISDEALKHLDKFEGIEDGDYSRQSVNVETEYRIVECFTYVLDGSRRLGGEWCPEKFSRNDLQYYLDNIVPKYAFI